VLLLPLLITALGAGLSACGSKAPLDGMPEAHLTQLDAVWTARIEATDSAPISVAYRNARVTKLYTACKPLDLTSALLNAISQTCAPTQITEKLGAVLPQRCASPAAICSRALDRIAQATDALQDHLKNLNTQAKGVITDPACLAEFTTNDLKLGAYGDLSSAYRVLALGVERKDKDITALGQHRIDDAELVLADKRPVKAQVSAFRKACGIDEG
jgi:hypothetical protein